MKYDFYVPPEGPPVMWIKHLVHVGGFRIDFHKMVQADPINLFHTHPAASYRFVLSGGYREQYWDYEKQCTRIRELTPGYFGRVDPTFCHRVDSLIGEESCSLWLRGRVSRNTFVGQLVANKSMPECELRMQFQDMGREDATYKTS